MWFFGRKPQRRQDGRTEETAFRLPPTGNAAGVAIEYDLLSKMFGRPDMDWRLHDRIRSRTEAGREIEKFIVSTCDGRRIVYFDITESLGSPDSEPVQQIMDRVIQRQRNRSVTITLPEGAFMMLFRIMEDVGPQLRSEKFDPGKIKNEIIQTTATRELGSNESFPLTLSVADWVHVISTARIIKVPNLLGQELTNDLISCIEGGLKGIGPGSELTNLST